MTSLLVKLYEHNRWANRRAAEACAGLTDAQLDATVPGTAGTVRNTLMHIAGAEQRYVMLLSGRQPAYSERDGWPGAEALRRALDESGSALMDLVGRADPDEVLRGERGGEPYAIPAAVVYTQAINHATEHRSQIATILTQQGVEPPDFQAWVWMDELSGPAGGAGQ
ncbi:MAG TPA: DinB family protein [Thermomicrobiales bacterium]|nr:DinB family protein [Thermomicrobiales bacterium]